MRLTTSMIVAAALLLTQTTQTFAMSANLDSDELIKQAIQQSIEDVAVLGLSPEVASVRFTEKVSERSTSELMHYIYAKASTSERAIFNEGINAKFQDRDTLIEALSTISLRQQMKTGSHFKMSCGVGLGIGVPLVLAGIIVAVVGLSNSRDLSAKIQKDHLDQAQQLSKEYEASTKDLKSWYQSTFTEYDSTNAQLIEVNEKIRNFNGPGCCCDASGTPYADLHAQLTAHLALMLTTRATLNQQILAADYEYKQKIDQNTLSESLALKDAAGKRKHYKNMTLVGGLTTAAGIPFLATGLNACRGGGSRTTNPRF